MSAQGPEASLVTAEYLRDWPLPRPEGSKHSRGHVLVVGGSPSTPGAVMLAGIAALRVGAGVLALAVAGSSAAAVAAAVPEASVLGLPQLDGHASDGRLASQLPGCAVVLVGPGLDDPRTTLDLVETVVEHADDDARLVVDAYALGVLNRTSAGERIGGRAVLTPNRTEAEHLLGTLDETASELAIAREIATRFRAVVTFQGCVADPDGTTWRVPAGHPGLGTSGSGDVLAGAITGLLARGVEPNQAACWATYLHAVAGDRLAARVGRLGFLARELAGELPIVLTETEA